MNKLTLTAAFISITFLSSFGQTSSGDKMSRVPKKISVETGYDYFFKSTYQRIPTSAYALVFDYAWQLSGFNGKAASYISVPLGYSSLPSMDTSKFSSSSMYYYGWTVRHNLASGKKIIPYLGYALMLTNLKEKSVAGSVMGHNTRFEFGVEYKVGIKNIVFCKIEYGFRRFSERGKK